MDVLQFKERYAAHLATVIKSLSEDMPIEEVKVHLLAALEQAATHDIETLTDQAVAEVEKEFGALDAELEKLHTDSHDAQLNQARQALFAVPS